MLGITMSCGRMRKERRGQMTDINKKCWKNFVINSMDGGGDLQGDSQVPNLVAYVDG